MGILRVVTAIATATIAAGCGDSSNPSAPSSGTAVVTLIVAGTPPPVGASSQFSAIAVHADGSSETITSQATWRSSNTSIATVASGGMVKAVAIGPVEIGATFGNKQGALAFTVTTAATYTMRGTISDAVSRAGVAAATVTVKEASGASKSATTDGSGRYAIAGLSSGTVDVIAASNDYVSATRSLMVLGDMTVDIALVRRQPCPPIAFDELLTHGAAFTTLTACGFTVTATTSNWVVSTSYGHPAPFIQFAAAAGMATVGEVVVSAAGGTFTFQSIEFYSSTTPIPYVITGIASSAAVLNLQGTLGNTFGGFAAVTNPQPTTPLEGLVIRLTNPAASCCSNPMGLDNILVAK